MRGGEPPHRRLVVTPDDLRLVVRLDTLAPRRRLRISCQDLVPKPRRVRRRIRIEV